MISDTNAIQLARQQTEILTHHLNRLESLAGPHKLELSAIHAMAGQKAAASLAEFLDALALRFQLHSLGQRIEAECGKRENTQNGEGGAA